MTNDDGETWDQQSVRWRRFWAGYLVFTVAFLVAVLVVDVHWGTRVGAVCNVLAASFGLVGARGRTTADREGLLVRYLRTRRIAWSDIAATQTAGDLPTSHTRVRLRDGETVNLPGVPAKDLDRLDETRRSSA